MSRTRIFLIAGIIVLLLGVAGYLQFKLAGALAAFGEPSKGSDATQERPPDE